MPFPTEVYDDNHVNGNTTSRNWVFTLFHYTWDMVLLLLDTTCRGIVFQEEVAPTTGHRHLQGFVRFNKGISKAQAFKALTHDNADMSHLWLRRSVAPAEAVAYCQKGETRDGECWSEGDLEFAQGKSSELRECAELIQSGCSIRDAAREYPLQFLLHDRGFTALRGISLEDSVPLFRTVKVYVLYGPSGVGKTRASYGFDAGLYKLDRASSTGVWFDGYDGQPTLLLDDFYGWIPYSQLLNLLDGYRCRLDVKGAHTYAAWNTVILTSNEPPEEWYSKAFPNGCPPALARRITAAYACSADTTLDSLLAFLRGELVGRAVSGVAPGGAVSGAFRASSAPSEFPGRSPRSGSHGRLHVDLTKD